MPLKIIIKIGVLFHENKLISMHQRMLYLHTKSPSHALKKYIYIYIFRRIVQLKMLISSSITHPHIVPNSYVFSNYIMINKTIYILQ